MHRSLIGALVLLGVAGTILALVPGDSSRAFAEQFASALEGQPGAIVDDYFAPDAKVFLQGATTAISPPEFRAYLGQLERSRHRFHVASPVYLTHDGAGWLLQIKNVSEAAIVDPPPVESPPQLWMQARVDERHVTRLWIHFTVEALGRLNIRPDVYRASAERNDIPLPGAWQDGTAAMVRAANGRDPRAGGVWSKSARRALMVVAWAPLLLALGAAIARGTPRRRQSARASCGWMLTMLSRRYPRQVGRSTTTGDDETTVCIAQQGS
jgi:hypothetical protein